MLTNNKKFQTEDLKTFAETMKTAVSHNQDDFLKAKEFGDRFIEKLKQSNDAASKRLLR